MDEYEINTELGISLSTHVGHFILLLFSHCQALVDLRVSVCGTLFIGDFIFQTSCTILHIIQVKRKHDLSHS